MASLMEELAGQLGGQSLTQLSDKLGLSEDQTSSAVSSALPMLFSALTRNAASSDGASALGAALDRDHDGSVLDDVAGFLGQGGNSHGAGILGHLLGSKQNQVADALGAKSGINGAQMGQLMSMLAPLVMGQLGKAQRQNRLDSNGLTDLLSGQQRQAERAQPGLGMLGKLLDQDGDGSVLDEVASAGAGLLGKFLSRR